MAEIHMSTDSLFIGPIKMRIDRFDARPLDKSNQKTGGENPRHGLEFGRLRIQVWHCFRFWNAESKIVFDPWLQRFFHLPSPISRFLQVSYTPCLARSQQSFDVLEGGSDWAYLKSSGCPVRRFCARENGSAKRRVDPSSSVYPGSQERI